MKLIITFAVLASLVSGILWLISRLGKHTESLHGAGWYAHGDGI